MKFICKLLSIILALCVFVQFFAVRPFTVGLILLDVFSIFVWAYTIYLHRLPEDPNPYIELPNEEELSPQQEIELALDT